MALTISKEYVTLMFEGRLGISDTEIWKFHAGFRAVAVKAASDSLVQVLRQNPEIAESRLIDLAAALSDAALSLIYEAALPVLGSKGADRYAHGVAIRVCVAYPEIALANFDRSEKIAEFVLKQLNEQSLSESEKFFVVVIVGAELLEADFRLANNALGCARRQGES